MQYHYLFENGEENIEDDQHPGRPREAVTPQNIAKIEDLIGDNPNISIRVIQDKIGISKDTICPHRRRLLREAGSNLALGERSARRRFAAGTVFWRLSSRRFQSNSSPFGPLP